MARRPAIALCQPASAVSLARWLSGQPHLWRTRTTQAGRDSPACRHVHPVSGETDCATPFGRTDAIEPGSVHPRSSRRWRSNSVSPRSRGRRISPWRARRHRYAIAVIALLTAFVSWIAFRTVVLAVRGSSFPPGHRFTRQWMRLPCREAMRLPARVPRRDSPFPPRGSWVPSLSAG